jgi:hypothetical protein
MRIKAHEREYAPELRKSENPFDTWVSISPFMVLIDATAHGGASLRRINYLTIKKR